MRELLVAGLALGLITISGCTQADKAGVREEVQGIRQQIGQATDQARRSAADTTLEGKVQSALALRKGLGGNHIDVDAKQGNVVLKGDVVSREAAELAEQVARDTEGVTTVDNQLTIRVPAKSVQPSGTMTVPSTPPATSGH